MFRNILSLRFVNVFKKSVRLRRDLALFRSPQCHAIGQPIISKCLCFALLSFVSLTQAECSRATPSDGQSKQEESAEEQINLSDELFSIGKFEESLKALEKFKDDDNVEVLWRISRALYNMSKAKGISTAENAFLIEDAFQYIERAMKLSKTHYAVHKWMAILFDAKSALEGMKSRINGLPVFKKHLMRAIELNPKDATSIYMLGQYMYNIADMSWLQKTIAKSLFGTPPEATFEEALHYFSRAEEVEPNFYSANLLMLGKTLLKLKRIGAARYWLKCALAYPVRTDEDEAVRLEAEELLKKHPEVQNTKKDNNAQNIQ